jgi:hypothetical protein
MFVDKYNNAYLTAYRLDFAHNWQGYTSELANTASVWSQMEHTCGPIDGVDVTTTELNGQPVILWTQYGNNSLISGAIYASFNSSGWTPYPVQPSLSFIFGNAYYKWMNTTSFSLAIASGAHGTTSPADGIYSHLSGETVTISGTPNNGYQLHHWIVNGSSGITGNPLTFTITGNTTVQPVFSLISSPPPLNSAFTMVVLVTNQNQNVSGAVVAVTGGYSGITNNGNAIFVLPTSTYTVSVTYLGKTQSKTVDLNADQQVIFDLSATSQSSLTPTALDIAIAIAIVAIIISIASILIVRKHHY